MRDETKFERMMKFADAVPVIRDGLTTMRTRRLGVRGSTRTFTFQDKIHVHRTIRLADGRLARIIQQCAGIPGYELFQYLDEAVRVLPSTPRL